MEFHRHDDGRFALEWSEPTVTGDEIWEEVNTVAEWLAPGDTRSLPELRYDAFKLVTDHLAAHGLVQLCGQWVEEQPFALAAAVRPSGEVRARRGRANPHGSSRRSGGGTARRRRPA